MSRIEELISVLDTDEVRSRAKIARFQRTCKICKGPAVQFNSYLAELEYSISSICQACQDYYLFDHSTDN